MIGYFKSKSSDDFSPKCLDIEDNLDSRGQIYDNEDLCWPSTLVSSSHTLAK